MSWNRASDASLENLRELIADLELCVDGKKSSRRWQAINVELVNARESLRVLTEKRAHASGRSSKEF